MTGPDERPPARVPLPNGLAYAIAAVYVVSALVLLGAIAWSGESWSDALTAHKLHSIDLAAVLGAVILRRQPGHVIGWLLVGVGAFEWIVLLSRAYQFLGFPDGLAVENRFSGLFVPATGLLVVAIPQLFPDGRLLSRRWRPLAWFGALAVTYLTVVFLATASDPGLPPALGVGFVLLGVAAVASVVPAALRFRRSRGTERQQFKWVIYGLTCSGALLAVGAVQIVGAGVSQANSALTLVAQGIIPVAFAVAVLRYRLYDVDVVINKTVVFVALAAFITAVYAAIVVGLGRLLPIGPGDLVLSIAATAVVAVLFEPVRARVQHAANRLVYGRRATPFEALAAMTAHLGRTADPGAALADAARLLAEGTGAARAVVWVARGGRLEPVGTAGGTAPDPVPLDGETAPLIPDADLMRPVHHEGRLVGALSLTKRPGEGVSSADRAPGARPHRPGDAAAGQHPSAGTPARAARRAARLPSSHVGRPGPGPARPRTRPARRRPAGGRRLQDQDRAGPHARDEGGRVRAGRAPRARRRERRPGRRVPARRRPRHLPAAAGVRGPRRGAGCAGPEGRHRGHRAGPRHHPLPPRGRGHGLLLRGRGRAELGPPRRGHPRPPPARRHRPGADALRDRRRHGLRPRTGHRAVPG